MCYCLKFQLIINYICILVFNHYILIIIFNFFLQEEELAALWHSVWVTWWPPTRSVPSETWDKSCFILLWYYVTLWCLDHPCFQQVVVIHEHYLPHCWPLCSFNVQCEVHGWIPRWWLWCFFRHKNLHCIYKVTLQKESAVRKKNFPIINL